MEKVVSIPWKVIKQKEKEEQVVEEKELSIAHYNVLVAPTFFAKFITQSETRYRLMFEDLFPSMMPVDIFCFNEVSPEFEELLVRYLQTNRFTHPSSSTPLVISSQEHKDGSHYCLILSFVPVIESFVVRLEPFGRPAVVALVEKNGESFIVCSVHLHAKEENFALRKKQLGGLCQSLVSRSFSERFQRVRDEGRILITGDFNFHLPLETELIYDLGYFDIWRDLHGQDVEAEEKGVTWDGKQSQYLLFDNRRMRLDRAIIPTKLTGFHPSSIEVFAKEYAKKCSFLHSDHYGLLTRFSWGGDRYTPNKFQKNTREIEHPSQTGYRTMSLIITIRVMSVLSLLVALVVVIVSSL